MLLTLQEAASQLHIHPETLRLRLGTEEAPSYIRQGRRVYIRDVAIKEFLDKREQV